LTLVSGCRAGAELSAVAATRHQYDRVVVVRAGGEPPGPVSLPVTVLDVRDLDEFARAWRRAAG